jgi:hypothetical protein
MATNSPEPKSREVVLPPLIQYRDLANYVPAYGDFLVWSGWLSTWCGVVTNYNKETKDLSIIFNSVPFVLFTLSPSEQEKETKVIKLEAIKNAPKGKYAVQQRDYSSSAAIWYI